MGLSSAGARAVAARVVAMRAELSEAQRRADAGEPGAKAMVVALKKDLFEQECRLAEVAR